MNSYKEIKHLNPRFPFMIRERPEADPYVIVEYGRFLQQSYMAAMHRHDIMFMHADFDYKVKIPLTGLSSSDIDTKIAEAVTKGEDMPRAYHQSVAPYRLPAVIE